jgi:GNAT superfamily N-acetyltransferase
VNPTDAAVRVAGPVDAAVVARLLHDFNTEFDTPTPGVGVLADRLRVLLAGETTFALLGGDPPVGLALVTLRPNVWYDGHVALLDELYVAPSERSQGVGGAMIRRLVAWCRDHRVDLIEINVDEVDVDARRFYERHGFSCGAPGSPDRALYYSAELDDLLRT